jgi:hypothetical protein
MLTAWPDIEQVVVLAVGPHDRSPTDVYDLLLRALDLEVSGDERNKPPCCDEAGDPPIGSDTATVIIDAVEALAKRRRARTG